MNFRKNNPHEGLTMPYDKETQDALQVYYETHDFTASLSFETRLKARAKANRLTPEKLTDYEVWIPMELK